MKLVVEREALLKALGHVTATVESRTTIPILSNVLLRAQDGRLRLSGTDLDIEIETSIPARVEIPGARTAPARELLDIAKKTPSGAEIGLTFESVTDKRLKVKAGRSNYALPTMPAEDFALMEGVKDASAFTLTGAELGFLIDQTRHATSTEDARFYLNGAYFHASADGAELIMAATDGHRLAVAKMPAPSGIAGAGVILPNKALNLIRQICDGAQSVDMRVGKAKVMVTVGDTALTSKVIDGSFPAYENIWPRAEAKITATLNGAELGRAIERASIVAKDKTRSLKFTFGDERLVVAANNTDGGLADAEMAAIVEGGEVTMGFNARYVQDVASLIGDTDMVVQLWDEKTPIVVRRPDDDGVSFLVCGQRGKRDE